LVHMGARWYNSRIGRWISPDTIVPAPANPQSLNRYTYVYNNSLRFIDSSGYDPLDEQWQTEFEAYHNRLPNWYDRLIRLFSIAFPEEWNWNAFYDSRRQLRGVEYDMSGNLINTNALDRAVFGNPGTSRNWSNMPAALQRLAGWYAKDEELAFVRDVGALFGGMLDRFDESDMGKAVCLKSNPAHVWVGIGRNGIDDRYLDNDWDANVHHRAWGFALGYWSGPIPLAGRTMNTIRDFRNPADVATGNLGVDMGSYLRWPFASFKKMEWHFGESSIFEFLLPDWYWRKPEGTVI
jgi:hypothetical protein